jgi:hypothetical protein
MKVRRMTVCDWHEQGRSDTVVEQPSWSAIEAAIRAMNGENLNDLYLDLDGEPEASVTVGGGGGRYIVSGSIDGESFPTLTDSSVPEEPYIELVVGGQLGEFAACYVVGLDRALEAVRSVAGSGAFTPEIGWAYV